jgi:hypothetical protein
MQYLAIISYYFKDTDVSEHIFNKNITELKDVADEEASRIARGCPGNNVEINYYELNGSWKWLSTSVHTVIPAKI